MKDHLRPSKIAAMLGVGPKAVIRWITSGLRAPDGTTHRLAALRFGSRYLVDPAELDLFLSRVSHRTKQATRTMEAVEQAMKAAGYTDCSSESINRRLAEILK